MNKLKLPSISYLGEQAAETFYRFPAGLINTIIGTLAASYLVAANKTDSTERPLVNLILTCVLALSLFIFITLLGERMKFDIRQKLAVHFTAVLVLLMYYFSLPVNHSESFNTVFITRFALYSIGLHLMVSFAPFMVKNELNGFWQYNSTLFQRILTALVYSSVLYAGLSIALYSINNLLEIKIAEKLYFQLWIYIAGLFNTWFFLAGIPKQPDNLENITEYPRDLKIFTQYILLPLVITYLAIIYLYGAKIAINRDWPKGMVSDLIIGCSFTGILSLLLIYPLQNTSEKAWIRQFSHIFYILLLPLSFMLFLAVNRRAYDYGITENRYFLFTISFWLFAISLYFIFSKVKNIKVIPITLCIIVFLISFGPWGAFSISQDSQLKRLENLLTANKILKDGIISRNHPDVPSTDNQEIRAISEYLNSRDQLQRTFKWFSTPPDLGGTQYEKPRKFFEAMGLTYSPYYSRNAQDFRHIYFNVADNNKITNIAGYSYLVKINIDDNLYPFVFKLDKKEFSLIKNKEKATVSLTSGTEKLAEVNLKSLINKLAKKYPAGSSQVLPVEMTVQNENEKLKLRFNFISLNGERNESQTKINYITGDMYLSLKQ